MQTARIIDPQSGETKMELRGHEHVVEVAVFAPPVAYPAIRELAGIPVRVTEILRCRPLTNYGLYRRTRNDRSDPVLT